MPEQTATRRNYATVIICEKVLTEGDHVHSAIRIAELFFYTPLLGPIPIEQQAVPLQFLATVRLDPPDFSEHLLELRLLRPDGESTVIGKPAMHSASNKFPNLDIPSGFNIHGGVGVIPKQMGRHYILFLMDGEEIARSPFTLVRREAEKAEQVAE